MCWELGRCVCVRVDERIDGYVEIESWLHLVEIYLVS